MIVTAYSDVPNAVKAMKLGAIDFLQKPLRPENLRSIVAEILKRHDEQRRATGRDFQRPHSRGETLPQSARVWQGSAALSKGIGVEREVSRSIQSSGRLGRGT